jgi:hypothetical protein
MNSFVYASIFGLLAVVLGLGIVSGFRYKDFEVTLTPKSSGFLVAIMGLVLFVIGALGLLGWVGQAPSPTPESQAPSPTPERSDEAATTTASPTEPTSPTTAGELQVELEEPTQGAEVPLEGTLVSGRATGDVGDSTLWLLTYSDGLWYLDAPINLDANGAFTLESGQIGVSSEAEKSFKLAIIEANSAQSTTINDKRPNAEGDITFSSLPGILRASVTVTRR